MLHVAGFRSLSLELQARGCYLLGALSTGKSAEDCRQINRQRQRSLVSKSWLASFSDNRAISGVPISEYPSKIRLMLKCADIKMSKSSVDTNRSKFPSSFCIRRSATDAPYSVCFCELIQPARHKSQPRPGINHIIFVTVVNISLSLSLSLLVAFCQEASPGVAALP